MGREDVVSSFDHREKEKEKEKPPKKDGKILPRQGLDLPQAKVASLPSSALCYNFCG